MAFTSPWGTGTAIILPLALIALASTIGFLFYNFHPAKIFMGDTGALFLGYCISVISLLGLYKSVTLFSFIVPVIILGVPVFDTTFAIIRRIVNKNLFQHQISRIYITVYLQWASLIVKRY